MRHLLAAAVAGFLLQRLFRGFGAPGSGRQFGTNSNWMGRRMNGLTSFLQQRRNLHDATNQFSMSTTQSVTDIMKQAAELSKTASKPAS